MSSESSRSGVIDPGELLFVGIEETFLTAGTRDLLRRVRPGGVILFRRNVAGLTGVAALCDDLRAATDPPPLIAIDEEGGRVTRLEPHVSGLPPAFATAALEPGRLRDYWRRYGDLLASLGIDMDFAPVVDLCPPDAANGIADRSFGEDPARVSACAAAVMDGLEAAGLLPTLKHFPGLGSTLLDSHHHLPAIRKSREAFEREDLAPFRALCSRAPAVMIGHGHYPFYSGPDPVAATLSRAIGADLLRGALGFAGTSISDDLEMKAVADRVEWSDLAPRVIEAGSDMVLVCHRADRILEAREALDRRTRTDAAFASRCREAAGRVAALRAAAAGARRRAGRSIDGRAAAEARIEATRAALIAAAAAVPPRAV